MTRKSRKETMAKSEPADEVRPPADRAPYWSFFFRDQRSPFVRGQLVTALMAGRALEVERLPAAALLDAVVLASAARCYHEAEIVDDFNALLRRADEAWRAPGWTCKVFDQTHMNAADFIIRGTTEFTALEDCYIPDLVGWLLEHEPPAYFARELA